MYHSLILGSILMLLAACSAPPSESSKAAPSIDSLFTHIEHYDESHSPFHLLSQGIHPDTFPEKSWASYQSHLQQYQHFQSQLNAIPIGTLSRQEQISREIMLLKLQGQIDPIVHHQVLIPFNAEGGFYNRIAYALNSLPFQEAKDYQAYIQWLPQYAQWLEQNQALMKQGMEEGVMAPQVIIRNMMRLMQVFLTNTDHSHPLATPLSQFPQTIPKSQRDTLEAQLVQTLEETILPAYQELYAFIRDEYLPAAPTAVGISEIPHGKEFYEARVRYFTTLPYSPDSIYSIGETEVARIRGLMQEILTELHFKGSFSDFLQFLRTDPQFYAQTPQILLRHAAWLSKKAEGKLPQLFSRLYMQPFTVEPVPDAIAPTYTGGRYVSGNIEQQKPGIYWVNTYKLPSRPLYTLPSLTLHEAVPGHHLQIMLAAELTDIPSFRNSFYISAFGEGWGLYAEYLGEEMGMYTTPYERFGRYTYEMWRACRLVVDVGLHYKGWTRQQAVDYLAQNTALSLHEVNTEIDRYIGWPGQALSYKMGEITIKRLREQAQATLGDRFDLRVFHDAILRNGSVPLPILEEEVEQYIKEG